jgi:hypothetical protein
MQGICSCYNIGGAPMLEESCCILHGKAMLQHELVHGGIRAGAAV